GERVERDEPLFEISTDKVDAEIPSPAAGVLTEIKFKEGETVEVNKVVAIIGDSDGATATPAATQAEVPAPAAQTAVASAPPSQPTTAPAQQPTQPAQTPPPQAVTASQPAAQAAPPKGAQTRGNGDAQTVEELRRTKSSPLVRNIAREHGIDISQLEGTGTSGRVTKNDILSYLESGASAQAPQARAPQVPGLPVPMPAPPVQPAVGDRVEPMSVMRRKIAEHMVLSRRTAAHVTTVYEIDMTRVARLRERHKAEFQQRTGTKLTFMPFIFQAITSAIHKFPIFNAQVSGDQI